MGPISDLHIYIIYLITPDPAVNNRLIGPVSATCEDQASSPARLAGKSENRNQGPHF